MALPFAGTKTSTDQSMEYEVMPIMLDGWRHVLIFINAWRACARRLR